jgi:hypothetical protein
MQLNGCHGNSVLTRPAPTPRLPSCQHLSAYFMPVGLSVVYALQRRISPRT